MGAQISKPSVRTGAPTRLREAAQEAPGPVERKPSHFAFHINDQSTTARLHRSASGRIELWDVPSEATVSAESDDASTSSTALSISPCAREGSPVEGVREGVERILLRSDEPSDEVASGVKAGAVPAARGASPKRAPTPAARGASPKRAPTPAARGASPKRAPTPAARGASPKRAPTPAARSASPGRGATPAARGASPGRGATPAAAPLPSPPMESELRDLLELQSLNLGLVSGGDSPPFVGELRIELVAASLLASRAKALRAPYAILEGEQDKMDAMPAAVLGGVRGRGDDAVVRLAWPKPAAAAQPAPAGSGGAAAAAAAAAAKPSAALEAGRLSFSVVATPAAGGARAAASPAPVSPVGSSSAVADLARDSPANPLDPTSPRGEEEREAAKRPDGRAAPAARVAEASPASSLASSVPASPTSPLPQRAPSGSSAASPASQMPRSKCVFYVVHSDASVSISIKDAPTGFGRRTRVLGEARLLPSQLAQGPSELRLDLVHPSKGTVVGVVSLRVSYRFLRGTFDHGGRLGAERFVLARSGRSMRARGARAAFENLSQVNHKLLAHDALYVLPEGWERGAAWTGPDAEVAVAGSAASGASLSAPASSAPSTVDPADAQYASSFVRPAPFCPTDAKKLTSKPCHYTSPTITGRFEYCVGRPAANRHVALFARRAAEMPDAREAIAAALERGAAEGAASPAAAAASSHLLPCYLGKSRTDHAGRMHPLRASRWAAQRPGQVEILGVLPDDVSCARGSLFVCQPGTKAVVFDIDGTLTLSDSQVIAQAVLDSVGGTTSLADELVKLWDPRPRRGALQVARAWAAKGYQIVYLSARYGALHALTLDWLSQHGYPPGPVCLRPGRYPTRFPTARFKADALLAMRAAGIEFVAGYGNQPTDVTAYRAAGIPDSAIRIAGHAAGVDNSVALVSWTDHLVADLADLPLAPVPTPYAELTFPKQPMYVKRKGDTAKAAGAAGAPAPVPRTLTSPAARRAGQAPALQHSRSFAPSASGRAAASPAPLNSSASLDDLDEELRVRSKSAPVLVRRKASFASRLMPRGVFGASGSRRGEGSSAGRSTPVGSGGARVGEIGGTGLGPLGVRAEASAGCATVSRRRVAPHQRPAASDPVRPGRALAGTYAAPAVSVADSVTHSQTASSSSFEGGSVSPPCPAAPAVSAASSEASATGSPAKVDLEVESAEAVSCRASIDASAPRRAPACEGGRA